MNWKFWPSEENTESPTQPGENNMENDFVSLQVLNNEEQ